MAAWGGITSPEQGLSLEEGAVFASVHDLVAGTMALPCSGLVALLANSGARLFMQAVLISAII